MTRSSLLPIMLLFLATTGCADDLATAGTPSTTTPPSADDLGRLASRRVFFGHQSVGADLLKGMDEVLAGRTGPGLRMVDATRSPLGEEPGFYQATIGHNGDPASKARDFAAALDRGGWRAGDIAMYKHCYLDVQPGTDAARMFADYRASLEALRARHPGVTFVHFTIPLTTDEGTAKYLVKRALGKPTGRGLNRKRNEFNRLLLAQYAGSDPVFDLALLESTRADGTRSGVISGAHPVYTLAEEWTSDGGHLNEAGRRFIAERFLAFLAEL